MPTSLLKRLLNRAASARPGDPQTICGSLAPGERVDIGALRAVNDGGDLVVKQLKPDGTLNWACSPDAELCISNLANRPDEGVLFSRFGAAAWAFVAKVRPERCVVLLPVPFDIPVCRFGPGGDYMQDWPEPAIDNGQLTIDNHESPIVHCPLSTVHCAPSSSAESPA